MQDFPRFIPDVGEPILLPWVRLIPASEANVPMPLPPGAEPVPPRGSDTSEMVVQDQKLGSGFNAFLRRRLTDGEGRTVAAGIVDKPWRPDQFEALAGAVEGVLNAHRFPLRDDGAESLLSAWIGQDFLWSYHPGCPGVLEENEWTDGRPDWFLESCTSGLGQDLWPEDSPFRWAQKLWPSICSRRSYENYLLARGVEGHIIAEFWRDAFEVGKIATEYNLRQRTAGSVDLGERNAESVRNANRINAENAKEHSRLWHKAMAKWLQPLIDVREQLEGRGISRDVAIDLVTENWPSNGFAGRAGERQRNCPGRDRLRQILAELERSAPPGTALLRRGKSGSAPPRQSM